MGKAFLWACLVAAIVACSEQNQQQPAPEIAAQKTAPVLVDVAGFVGDDKELVDQKIGPSERCSKTKHGQECIYKKGQVEVVFINGRADWITVQGTSSVPYDDTALEYFGFKPQRSTFDNEYHIRWSGVQNMLLIQMANGGNGKTQFAYMKHTTP